MTNGAKTCLIYWYTIYIFIICMYKKIKYIELIKINDNKKNKIKTNMGIKC